MEKALFLANSVYHLLTAAHLRLLAPPGEEADLVVTDATPSLPGLIPRLRETGLFARVIPARAGELAQRYPMNRPEAAAQCLESRESVLRWALGEELEPAYRQVYYPNPDWLARLLACRYACPFFWIEDGFSSYVIDYFRPDRAAVNRHPLGQALREKTQQALLYEPGLALRGDGLPNRPLPKLPREGPLRETLNFVFDYQPPQGLPPFLFLEQSFRAEGIQGNDLELMAECRNAVGAENFGVKPHPRNPGNLPAELGLTGPLGLDAPFELVLLNQGAGRCALLTVCSNGALSPRLCLGLDEDTVLLYKLYTGRVLWKENEALARFLEAYCRRCAGRNTFVPQTVYELRSTLAYLGGRHGL